MSIRDVRDAFVQAGQGKIVCTAARMRIERHDEVEYQRLEFDGVISGETFSITSDRVRPGGSLITMAKETADRVLERGAQLQRQQPDPPPAETPGETPP